MRNISVVLDFIATAIWLQTRPPERPATTNPANAATDQTVPLTPLLPSRSRWKCGMSSLPTPRPQATTI
jgi:hypothetical protein